MPDDDQSSSPASSSDKSIAGVPPSSAARNANVRRSQQQSSIIAVDDGIGVEPANECGDVPSSPATPPQRPVASPVHPSFSFSSESLPWSPRASQQTHSGKTSKITLSRRQQQQQQIPNAGSSSVLVPLISAAFDALAEPILVVQSGCGAQTLPPLARAPLVVIFANRAARILFGSTSASVEQSPSHSARITMSSPAASGITAPVSSPCSSLRGVSVSKLIPALRLSTLSSLSTSDVIVSSPYPKSLAVKRSTAHDKKGSPASPANTATTSPVIPVKSISKSFKARTLQSHGESSEEFRVHVSVSKLPPEALAAQLAGAPLPVHSARQSSSTARSGEGASTAWVLTLKKVAKSEKGLNSRYKSEFEELECIGKGGYGVVYKARNLLDGQDYAVKKVKLTCKPEDFASLAAANITSGSGSTAAGDTNLTCSTIDTMLPTANRTPKRPDGVATAARRQRRLSQSDSRLLSEVKMFARLANHPNIVNYHTAWIEGVEDESSSQSESEAGEDADEQTPSVSRNLEEERTSNTSATNTTTTTSIHSAASNASLVDLPPSSMFRRPSSSHTSGTSATSSPSLDPRTSLTVPTSPLSLFAKMNSSTSSVASSGHDSLTDPGSSLDSHHSAGSSLDLEFSFNRQTPSSNLFGGGWSLPSMLAAPMPPPPPPSTNSGTPASSSSDLFERVPLPDFSKKTRSQLPAGKRSSLLSTGLSGGSISGSPRQEQPNGKPFGRGSHRLQASLSVANADFSNNPFWQSNSPFAESSDVSDVSGAAGIDGTKRRVAGRRRSGQVDSAPPQGGGNRKARPHKAVPRHAATLYIQMQLCPFMDLRTYIAARDTTSYRSSSSQSAPTAGNNSEKREESDAGEPSDGLLFAELDSQAASSERRRANLFIFRQIVDGLVHIHSQGVIHRDLKPDNIFVQEDLQVLLGDFGLAKSIMDHALTPGVGWNGEEVATEASTNQGTYFYIAPEIHAHQTCTTRSDMYSLGILLLELFHSFGTGMERVVNFTHIKNTNTLPPAISEQLPPDVARLVTRLISSDPSKRPSAVEVLSDPVFFDLHHGQYMQMMSPTGPIFNWAVYPQQYQNDTLGSSFPPAPHHHPPLRHHRSFTAGTAASFSASTYHPPHLHSILSSAHHAHTTDGISGGYSAFPFGAFSVPSHPPQLWSPYHQHLFSSSVQTHSPDSTHVSDLTGFDTLTGRRGRAMSELTSVPTPTGSYFERASVASQPEANSSGSGRSMLASAPSGREVGVYDGDDESPHAVGGDYANSGPTSAILPPASWSSWHNPQWPMFRRPPAQLHTPYVTSSFLQSGHPLQEHESGQTQALSLSNFDDGLTGVEVTSRHSIDEFMASAGPAFRMEDLLDGSPSSGESPGGGMVIPSPPLASTVATSAASTLRRVDSRSRPHSVSGTSCDASMRPMSPWPASFSLQQAYPSTPLPAGSIIGGKPQEASASSGRLSSVSSIGSTLSASTSVYRRVTPGEASATSPVPTADSFADSVGGSLERGGGSGEAPKMQRLRATADVVAGGADQATPPRPSVEPAPAADAWTATHLGSAFSSLFGFFKRSSATPEPSDTVTMQSAGSGSISSASSTAQAATMSTATTPSGSGTVGGFRWRRQTAPMTVRHQASNEMAAISPIMPLQPQPATAAAHLSSPYFVQSEVPSQHLQHHHHHHHTLRHQASLPSGFAPSILAHSSTASQPLSSSPSLAHSPLQPPSRALRHHPRSFDGSPMAAGNTASSALGVAELTPSHYSRRHVRSMTHHGTAFPRASESPPPSVEFGPPPFPSVAAAADPILQQQETIKALERDVSVLVAQLEAMHLRQMEMEEALAGERAKAAQRR